MLLLQTESCSIIVSDFLYIHRHIAAMDCECPRSTENKNILLNSKQIRMKT